MDVIDASGCISITIYLVIYAVCIPMHRNVKKRDLYKSESCPLNGTYLNLSNINPAVSFVDAI